MDKHYDLFHKILSFDETKIYSVETDHMTNRERCIVAREVIKIVSGKSPVSWGVSVRKDGGIIRVDMPNAHSYDGGHAHECPKRKVSGGPNSTWHEHCAYCETRNEATTQLENLLVRAMPKTQNKNDSQRDYFQFTWAIY